MHRSGHLLLPPVLLLAACNALWGVDELRFSATGPVPSGGAGGATTSSGAGSVGAGGLGGSTTVTSGGGGAAGSGASVTVGGSGGSGGGGGGETVLETLTIPCSGTTIQSSTLLLAGEIYRLRASGTCTVNTIEGTLADADWADFDNPRDFSSGGGVDIGVGVDDPTVDTTLNPKWGPYDPAHVYMVDFVGQGTAISVRYHDPDYTNNAGQQTLEILAPQ